MFGNLSQCFSLQKCGDAVKMELADAACLHKMPGRNQNVMPVYTPLQQRAYEYLKDIIVSDRLSRDEVYSEARFAKELKISRTPVREALQRLSQEGYVDILPSRGFVIHPLTEGDIVAMYQMRTAIESFCLMHYAANHTAPATQELLKALGENLTLQRECLENSGDKTLFFEYDCELHRLVVTQIGNPWFTEAFEKYVRQFRTMTKWTLNQTIRIEQSIREHEEICSILREGEPSSVYAWLHRHLAFATQYTLELVKRSSLQ